MILSFLAFFYCELLSLSCRPDLPIFEVFVKRCTYDFVFGCQRGHCHTLKKYRQALKIPCTTEVSGGFFVQTIYVLFSYIYIYIYNQWSHIGWVHTWGIKRLVWQGQDACVYCWLCFSYSHPKQCAHLRQPAFLLVVSWTRESNENIMRHTHRHTHRHTNPFPPI